LTTTTGAPIPRSWSRFAGSLLVLAVIAIGIPAGLVALTRLALDASHPLPGLGTWDEIRSWLSDQRSSTEIARVALRVLIAVCWLLWAALFVSILSTIHANRPRFDRLRLPRLAVFDGIGTWIAAGLMIITTLHPRTANAAPLPTRAAATATVAAPPASLDGLLTTQPAAVVAKAGWGIVQPGESIETFAQRTLGDSARWPEIWDLNHDRAMPGGATWSEPWRINAGWELELPATTSTTFADEPATDTPNDPAIAAHRIVAGDTLWDILDDHYGHVDAGLVRFVADHNQLADPNSIPISTDVQLPPEPSAQPVPPGVAVHRIVAGDTLWGILDDHYGHVDATLVRFVADHNQLADPNSIPIGTDVQLPPLFPPDTPSPAEDPAAQPPTGETSTPAPATDEPAAPAEPAEPAVPAPGWPPPTPPRTAMPATIPAPAATTPPTTATTGAHDAPVPAEASASSGDDSLFDFTVRTLWWQIPAGSLLAGGIVVMIRRLRGRRWHDLQPGQQPAAPPAVAAGTELAALSTDPTARLRTLTRVLRILTPHVRELDDPPPVRAVELDEDRIEILFADAAPFPPAGWTTPNGGRSWTYRLPDTTPDGPVRQLITPSLITIGHRSDGGEVLLDLETAGSLSLIGDRAACLGVARSIALELSTYPLGVPMDVGLVGLAVDGVEHCDRAWTNTTMTRAVRVAREMLERTADTGDASLVAARARLDDDHGYLDPHVFLVDTNHLDDSDRLLVDTLVELCQPQSGAAVVLIGGDHPSAGEVITVHPDGTATWAGATLTAPVLSREAVAQVAVTFDHAANAPIERLTQSPLIADLLTHPNDADDDGEGEDQTGELIDDDLVDERSGYRAPQPDVVVRVMGEVTVTGTGHLTADQTELLALLVCLRDERPNVDTVATWLDGTRKSIQNRISALRAKLGVGSDGAELLPVASVGRGSDGRYRLSPQIMTDVELLEYRYQASLQLSSVDALEVLRDGLDLMGGPAFRAAKGYNWATPHGVQARLAAIVNAYATRLMRLALDADELDLVHETVRRAETVIDDVVAETPLHRVEREIADATGHPALRDGVTKALQRLSAYVDETDRVHPETL
jgi:hypothetical protein